MKQSARKYPQVEFDSFYQKGGWKYDLVEETRFLQSRVLQPLGVGRGLAIELGCGMGVHSEALRLLMGAAHGVDISTVGIELARKQFPEVSFTQADVLQFMSDGPQCDLVFARGMNWFHYELEDGASAFPLDALMRASMNCLPIGGHFVLQVRTNFSGDREPATGLRNHRVSQLRSWAHRYGNLRMITDWMGLPLALNRDGRASRRNAIVAIAKT